MYKKILEAFPLFAFVSVANLHFKNVNQKHAAIKGIRSLKAFPLFDEVKLVVRNFNQ